MQKDTVEVIINADGKSCTTTNPFGKEPNTIIYEDDRSCHFIFKYWQQAENNRKTYKIDFSSEDDLDFNGFDNAEKYKQGSIRKAQIINGKAVIQ